MNYQHEILMIASVAMAALLGCNNEKPQPNGPAQSKVVTWDGDIVDWGNFGGVGIDPGKTTDAGKTLEEIIPGSSIQSVVAIERRKAPSYEGEFQTTYADNPRRLFQHLHSSSVVSVEFQGVDARAGTSLVLLITTPERLWRLSVWESHHEAEALKPTVYLKDETGQTTTFVLPVLQSEPK